MLGKNLYADSVVGSKHDLSTTGPGIQASTETRICVFCHIPHNASPLAPLWNHSPTLVLNYTKYTSSTIDASIGQPNGSSKLCLSCHDGTVALGSVLSSGTPFDMVNVPDLDANDSLSAAAAGYIGTNLSDDHPISFIRDAGDLETQDPLPVGGPVKLDASSQIQCTSCHDAHDNQYSYFLVKDNIDTGIGSQICLACHIKANWNASSHEGATGVTYTGGRPGPFGTGSVAEYGCEACHDPHSASESWRLLDDDPAGGKVVEEAVCYNCHEGTIASTDIQDQFINRTYIHPIADYSNVHQPNEAYAPSTEHVECVDCHNPHQAQGTVHVLGVDDNMLPANSVLEGVKGIGASSYSAAWSPPDTFTSNILSASISSKEYELCFRCHSTASGMFPGGGDEKGNMDIYFNDQNAAHHAVYVPGKIQDAANMNQTLTNCDVTSTIYCSDCHGDDAAGSPAGPHGSGTEYLLSGYNGGYVCYKCHKEEVYSGSGTDSGLSRFPDHNRNNHHTTTGFPPGTPAISCFMCHGDFSDSQDGLYKVGGIHGANSGNLYISSTNWPNQFLNGIGLKIRVKTPKTNECGGRLEGGLGCNKHLPFNEEYEKPW